MERIKELRKRLLEVQEELEKAAAVVKVQAPHFDYDSTKSMEHNQAAATKHFASHGHPFGNNPPALNKYLKGRRDITERQDNIDADRASTSARIKVDATYAANKKLNKSIDDRLDDLLKSLIKKPGESKGRSEQERLEEKLKDPKVREAALRSNVKASAPILDHAKKKKEQNAEYDKAVVADDPDQRPAVAQKKRTATFIDQFNRRKEAPDKKLINKENKGEL